MSKINDIFINLERLTQKDGQSEFISVLIANVISKNDVSLSTDRLMTIPLLRSFLGKIFTSINELSEEILNDNSILISVKNQKILRTCFQLITSIGISPCLIPGLGISLSRRCSSSRIVQKINLSDEEKYELLVDCTNLFIRSYRVPVLKNIIITLHLSDFLAALIQLSFAPLKKPGNYSNFIMTKEKYDKLTLDKSQFVIVYENLITNCFQPTLMKELLVLQSITDPSPPAFAKRIITKELSRRLLASGGLLSLIRCFIESYNIDAGLEWKKIEMISKIVSAKHGDITEDEYLCNISAQLSRILSMNNTHYLATAVACILNLQAKYPHADSIQELIKYIFEAFVHDSLKKGISLPGSIIYSPQDIEHKVNLLHASVCLTHIDWDVGLLNPNLHILFMVGAKCVKSEDLKNKITDILLKCLENSNCQEATEFMKHILIDNNYLLNTIVIQEYEAGIAIKSSPPDNEFSNDDVSNENLLFFVNIFKSVSSDKFVKNVFQASLDILIEISKKWGIRKNRKLLLLENEPELVDNLDKNYGVILQLLTEMSTSPKVVTALKNDPSIVINFIEYFLYKKDDKTDEECTTIALILLNTVLGNVHRNDYLEERLTSVIPVLQKMSQEESSLNNILCKEALSIISTGKTDRKNSAYNKAVSNVFDSLLPVRAHGIIELTKLIDVKDAETISKKHYIFCLLQEQLKDPDSYIYLSAIKGLAALCTLCTEDVLHVLCKEFLQTSDECIPTEQSSNKVAEVRMKIGDVIVKVTKKLGEMAIVHKAVLLNTMLCGCRDDDPLIRASALSNLAEIALVLHYKMGTIIYEVLLCIWSIIETDKAVECRRAATMVISSLLKGLGKDTLLQLKENLLPVYRTLKNLYSKNDEDSVVRLHAQIALEELNDIVEQFLFPEVKLEKQIFVIDEPENSFK